LSDSPPDSTVSSPILTSGAPEVISPGAAVSPVTALSPEAAVEQVIVTAKKQDEDKPPSLLAYPATYLLVGINLLVFGIMFRFSPAVDMIRHHAGLAILTAPFDPDTLVRFGAMDKQLVLAGQWWRLISSTFVHVTILHVLLNMWCLWNLGLFGEPLLGRRGLIAVYILTGWAGMMLSLAWSVFTRQDALVAGASGAVFGLAGILIILLSNRKLSLPWNELRALRRSVLYFAVVNLGIGILPNLIPGSSSAQLHRFHLDPSMLPRVSMSAHLGGFFYGLALGLPLFPRMTSGRQSYRARQRLVFALAGFALCLVGYAVGSFAR
jgi:rhomboid protease GluP